MFDFLKKRFRRKPADKLATPTPVGRSASSFSASSSQPTRSDPSSDLLNPLNPLNPLSPFSPLNQVDSYDPPRSNSQCSKQTLLPTSSLLYRSLETKDRARLL